MATTRVLPVIMSGGSGTRLWPLSTHDRPKQFHPLGARRSMIVETASRLSGAYDDIIFLDPVVIAGAAHRDLLVELLDLAGIRPAALVLEPEGRNTAATAALAALVGQELDPSALVLLAPADHLVAKPESLIATIRASAPIATTRIVTFGIEPSGPETGYGYIRQGMALSPGVHEIASFEEKPELPDAMRYLREGGYSWNSGMFFFNPTVMIEEFAAVSADISDGAKQALANSRREGLEIHLDPDVFRSIRSAPVDKAVMEKTKRAAVAPCDIGWADVGSWAELWRLSEKDSHGNVVSGSATLLDGKNNLVRGEGIHVSAVGVSDLVIVATPDAVLIVPRARSQDVKLVAPKKA